MAGRASVLGSRLSIKGNAFYLYEGHALITSFSRHALKALTSSFCLVLIHFPHYPMTDEFINCSLISFKLGLYKDKKADPAED